MNIITNPFKVFTHVYMGLREREKETINLTYISEDQYTIGIIFCVSSSHSQFVRRCCFIVKNTVNAHRKIKISKNITIWINRETSIISVYNTEGRRLIVANIRVRDCDRFTRRINLKICFKIYHLSKYKLIKSVWLVHT